MHSAIVDADIIYTDCWPARGTDEEQQKIRELFLPYQVTEDILRISPQDALFLAMNCGPRQYSTGLPSSLLNTRSMSCQDSPDLLPENRSIDNWSPSGRKQEDRMRGSRSDAYQRLQYL